MLGWGIEVCVTDLWFYSFYETLVLDIIQMINKLSSTQMLLWRSLINHIVIKNQRRMRALINFPTKKTYWPCFLGSGLKLIFHFCTLWLILAKSLLSSAAALSILFITEINEVSLANNLALHDQLLHLCTSKHWQPQYWSLWDSCFNISRRRNLFV